MGFKKFALVFKKENRYFKKSINMKELSSPVSYNINSVYSPCSSNLYDSLSNSAVGSVLDHRIT